MRLFDLHIHTNFSDGLDSIETIIDKALEKNIYGIAITDHDTIDAINYLSCNKIKFNNISIIPGIELSSDINGEEVHILGYFIDCENINLNNELRRLKEDRFSRGLLILEKLSSLGLNLEIDSIINEAKIINNGFIGRAFIARKLVSYGFVKDIKEAFDKYLGEDRPAYINRNKLSLSDSIDLITKSSGIPVLAHPGMIKDKTIVKKTIELGIKGIECFTSKHTKEDERYFVDVCKKNNLIITGGSDYHGDKNNLGKFYTYIDEIELFKLKCFENKII